MRYGNGIDYVIESGDLNDGARYSVRTDSILGTYQSVTSTSTKASGTYWALTTGALKSASINNIHDMAGNMLEWTMEGCSYGRSHRGSYSMVSSRGKYYSPNIGNDRIGFRSALYIKNI